MIENTTHNLMYSASPTKFGKYISVVQESMGTYEPTLRGASPEDVKKHAIAQSLRLSQIFYEQMNYDLSLEYINEGLDLEPNNLELIELKNKILSSLGGIKKEVDTKNAMNKSNNNDSEPNPFMFMVLSIVGALILRFQKSIAEGTGAPGIARITVPMIGFVMIIYGVVEGLFGKGFVFFGIVTSLIALLIISSPLLYPIFKEKIGNK